MGTQHRAYAGFHGRPGDPYDRLPVVRPQEFTLGPTRPEDLLRGLERADGAYGRVRWAGRDVLVALYAPEGSSLRSPVLCVDVDGDGTFEAVGEQRRVTTHASDRGQRWQVELAVDGVSAQLEVERVPMLRRLLRVDGGVRRRQVPDLPPPGGVLVPGGGKADLVARMRAGGREVLVGAVLPAEGTARVGVDTNGDRRLDLPSEWVDASSVEAAAGERAWRAETKVGAEPLTLRIEERPALTTGTLAPTGALRGTVNVGGRTLALFLLDRDLDGAFTSPEDLWWLGPLERLARVHELTPETMVEGHEPVFTLGAAWRVSIVEADGTAHLVADPASKPGAYLARRHERSAAAWAPRLELEARAFREANGIDPARPRAEAPVAWHHATDLTATLALAREQGKPVFAFFEADWCLWCRRLDLHTFGDAEVAELLSRFVCVRLNYEFMTGHEYERYGGRGLPLILLMDADGKLLERPDRPSCDPCRGALLSAFEAPHVFAGRLRAALR